MIKFGSVCSGIEAASVAWNPLGWSAAWFSEIEPFPCELLRRRFPSVRNLGDMTQIPAMLSMDIIDAPDILCGGTPCQAFSVAGKRKSLDDDRGNLSLIFTEIADELDESRKLAGERTLRHLLGKRTRSPQHKRQRLRVIPGTACWRRRSPHARRKPMAV